MAAVSKTANDVSRSGVQIPVLTVVGSLPTNVSVAHHLTTTTMLAEKPMYIERILVLELLLSV